MLHSYVVPLSFFLISGFSLWAIDNLKFRRVSSCSSNRAFSNALHNAPGWVTKRQTWFFWSFWSCHPSLYPKLESYSRENCIRTESEMPEIISKENEFTETLDDQVCQSNNWEKYFSSIFPVFMTLGVGTASDFIIAPKQLATSRIFWSKINIFSIYVLKNSPFSGCHCDGNVLVICWPDVEKNESKIAINYNF